MRKIMHSLSFWLIIVELIVVIILWTRGFRITYAPDLENNWQAISAIGEWAGAIVGILIPLAAVFVQHKLDETKTEIGASNVELLKLVDEKIDEKLRPAAVQNVDINEERKKKALKFIDISMFAKTQKVADYLGVSKEECFNLLVEMLRHDGTISAGGQVTERNIDNVTWIKKKR